MKTLVCDICGSEILHEDNLAVMFHNMLSGRQVRMRRSRLRGWKSLDVCANCWENLMHGLELKRQRLDALLRREEAQRECEE